MKESEFIAKNEASWRELERYLDNNYKDPDRLQRLFMKVSSDLSYARTFYPNRSVRRYLNNLTQRVFDQLIRRTRKENTFQQITHWFAHTLPMELYKSQRLLLVSFLTFWLAFGIGFFTSRHDASFTRLMLGDRYVNMTEENINNGDPMAVYKDEEDIDMFLGITLNNIMVSFAAFIMGILAGAGTVYILIFNGIMIGAFQYFFYERGLFLTSFLTIWIHGTIEISAIIIAGAAGLLLGRGMLFPGTYSRKDAMHIHAKRALTVVLSTTPLFIIAGLLESFVTRHTGFPDIVRMGIILISLSFILFLYVIYPRIYMRNLPEDHKSLVERDDYLNIVPRDLKKAHFDFGTIFSSSLADTQHSYGRFLTWAFLPMMIIFIITHYFQISFWDTDEASHWRAPGIFNFGPIGLLNAIVLWVGVAWTYLIVSTKKINRSAILRTMPILLLITFASVFIINVLPTNKPLLLFLILPPGLIALFPLKTLGDEYVKNMSFKTLYTMAWRSYIPFMAVTIIYILLLISLLQFINSDLMLFTGELFVWHDVFNTAHVSRMYLTDILSVAVFILLQPLYFSLLRRVAWSQLVKQSAQDLQLKIKLFDA